MTISIFKSFFKRSVFYWTAFFLLLTCSLFLSACSCGGEINTNDSVTINNTAAEDLQKLKKSTSIDNLTNKMFVWLDASIPSLFSLNSDGKLTNWVDRNNYTIAQTNIITNGNTATLSYHLTSPVSTTPKSDVSANESKGLVVSTTGKGNNNYVKVDYEGSDRVGFKIDTSSMPSNHQVAAFYLVTESVQGNNGGYIPLGYNDLGQYRRFLTKFRNERKYISDYSRRYSKSGMTLNEEAVAKIRGFGIPDTLHLLSATNLNISSRDLNGTLGTFPINSHSISGGGE